MITLTSYSSVYSQRPRHEFLLPPRVFNFRRELSFLPWAFLFYPELFFFAVSFSFCRELFSFAVSFSFWPWAFLFCRELFSFAVSFLFCRELFSLLPWAFLFCRELFFFAVSFSLLPWHLWATVVPRADKTLSSDDNWSAAERVLSHLLRLGNRGRIDLCSQCWDTSSEVLHKNQAKSKWFVSLLMFV